MMFGKCRLNLLTPMTQLVLVSLIALTISLPCVAENTQSPNAPVILIMGDSLSAGFGIKLSEDWASLLEQRLVSENLAYRVVNASISGETTNGGLNRLAQTLETHRPQVVILELGANDGLRGLPLYLIRNNLSHMIKLCQQANTRVLLLGMRLPPNYGPRYTHDFTQIFADLAKEYETGLVPFLLAGVATQPELMQSDGLHPTAAAQPQLLDTIWPQLLPLMKN
jgi:acyl-CoA thioesterase-1